MIEISRKEFNKITKEYSHIGPDKDVKYYKYDDYYVISPTKTIHFIDVVKENGESFSIYGKDINDLIKFGFVSQYMRYGGENHVNYMTMYRDKIFYLENGAYSDLFMIKQNLLIFENAENYEGNMYTLVIFKDGIKKEIDSRKSFKKYFFESYESFILRSLYNFDK